MIWSALIILVILIIAYMIRAMALADGCCGNCTRYSSCWRSHPEYLKQNTLEHPCCKDYKV